MLLNNNVDTGIEFKNKIMIGTAKRTGTQSKNTNCCYCERSYVEVNPMNRLVHLVFMNLLSGVDLSKVKFLFYFILFLIFG